MKAEPPRIPSTSELARYIDEYLGIAEHADWAHALNGLQVENSGRISRIGAAVDASSRTFAAAAERGIDFLIVHHGLFWPGLQPVTGSYHRQLKQLFGRDIALYSAHLPLDSHPLVGNNAQLAAALELENAEPFMELKGVLTGFKARAVVSRDELVRRLEHSLGSPVKSIACGPAETSVIGIVSGGAGGEIYVAAREGIDTYITGEAPHWAAVAAEELGMNLLLGGHYATETFGVKALAAHLSERFELPWEFIAAPTGL